MQSNYRLPVGGLVAKSIGIYFGNLLPFVALSAIALAPWIVMLFYLEAQPRPETATAPRSVWDATPTGPELVATLLQQIGTLVLTGALTFGVVQKLRGMQADLGQTLAIGVKSFLRVLLIGIVYGVLVCIGLLVFVVPGLMLMTIFYVALPAAVLESKGIGASLSRSADLTRGNRWPIFGAVVLFWLLILVVSTVFGVVMVAAVKNGVLPAWLQVTLHVVLAPFGATMPAVCYYMLRMGKENVDAKQIAAVFD
jgi:hypothetical protein